MTQCGLYIGSPASLSWQYYAQHDALNVLESTKLNARGSLHSILGWGRMGLGDGKESREGRAVVCRAWTLQLTLWVSRSFI